MPNTPSQIGSGISVWTSSREVTTSAKTTVEYILGALGTQIYVEREDYLDMATAISGSGPAYVFAFMETLTAAAIESGLPETMAQQLVIDTVLGSAKLAKETGKEVSYLRAAVTSPGGTTESALSELERHGFQTAIKHAVRAAHDRARSIGSQIEEHKQ
jgi:pyrroline-5-carboxylate reductase